MKEITKKKTIFTIIGTFFSKPANCMLFVFAILLSVLTLYPMISMLREMFVVHSGIEKTLTGLKKGQFTFFHWSKLFRGGDWSMTNFWVPFINSTLLGFGGAVLGILIGGVVAWLMARTNLKHKN